MDPRPTREIEPAEPGRVDPRDLARRLRAGHELHLVCAYDSERAFEKLALEGALSLAQLEALRPSLEPDAEVVVYCRCPADKTAVQLARRLRAEGLERVRVLAGGWRAALAAGLRVRRSSGAGP